MKKIIIHFIIPIFILSSCKKQDICPHLDLAISDINNQEEYLIIDAILNERVNDLKVVQISQRTHFYLEPSSFDAYFENDRFLFDSTKIQEYIALNSTPHTWGDVFTEKLELINPEELECQFGAEGDAWVGYYSKYDDSSGFLQFGRPILNDNNEALVIYEHYCGWECAGGNVVILEKENGEWSIKENIAIWIS